MANENKEQERRYITGESFDELCNRYRAMILANKDKSWEEQRDAINKFRCGY